MMDAEHFDQLIRAAAKGSRRGYLRSLVAAFFATLLAGSSSSASQLDGTVIVGGACATTQDCHQSDMQRGAICADNGFSSDGDLNCCLQSGCCQSDADCCEAFRCVPTYDVCNV